MLVREGRCSHGGRVIKERTMVLLLFVIMMFLCIPLFVEEWNIFVFESHIMSDPGWFLRRNLLLFAVWPSDQVVLPQNVSQV